MAITSGQLWQSNPYGIPYKNYCSAKKISDDIDDFLEGRNLKDLSTTEILALQGKIKGKLLKYLTSSRPTSSGFLPFAPYIESKGWGTVCQSMSKVTGKHLTSQPIDTPYNVPTVVGFNTDESNIFTSMFEALLYANIKDKNGEYIFGGDVILENGMDVREFIDSEAVGGFYSLLVKVFFRWNSEC